MGAASLFLKDHTIVHAFDTPLIAQGKEKNQNMRLSQKAQHGIAIGAKGWVQVLALEFLLARLTKNYFENGNASEKLGFIGPVLIAPVLEEIIFRGILQNGIRYGQTFAQQIAPDAIKNTRVFQWAMSSSARILAANTTFALAHWNNAGGYLSTAETVRQVGIIFLMPHLSILHETTGDIAAPIACHMTHNLLNRLIPLANV